jgi:hypothetical protein
MAAAPNLPLSESITWDITIDDTYTPSRQGIVVSQGDQINFENESGVDIIIEFQPNVLNGQNQTPVYPPMSLSVSNGGSNSFTAPNANCAANYYIYNADVTPPAQLSGPFVIQVGTGTMYVTVAGTVTNPTYSPQTVAVPLGTSLPPGAGKLQMNPGPSSSFGITWLNNNDPCTPPITQTDGTPHGVAQTSALATYTYYVGPAPVENPAGGRVIVQS